MEAQIQEFLMGLVGKFPVVGLVLMILGMLVVLGLAVVGATASKADDEKAQALLAKPVIGHILRALIAFSPVQLKKAQ